MLVHKVLKQFSSSIAQNFKIPKVFFMVVVTTHNQSDITGKVCIRPSYAFFNLFGRWVMEGLGPSAKSAKAVLFNI